MRNGKKSVEQLWRNREKFDALRKRSKELNKKRIAKKSKKGGRSQEEEIKWGNKFKRNS